MRLAFFFGVFSNKTRIKKGREKAEIKATGRKLFNFVWDLNGRQATSESLGSNVCGKA